MTPAQFKRKAEAAFRRANPDAAVAGVAFKWTFVSRPCNYRDGSGSFRNGFATVSAPGFRTRNVNATAHLPTGYVVVR